MENKNQSTQTAEKNSELSDYQPGSDWSLFWADEFDADTINPENWNLQVVEAGRYNEEWQRYTNSDRNAFIEKSCLVIRSIHESDEHGADQYTSARLNTANKVTFTYGKVAARIKLPKGKGIWPAFWMLGANIDENGGDTPWPQSGEIDILELYGTNDDGVIEANLHHADLSGKHTMMGAVAYKLPEGIFADDFHVFELDWSETKMVWSVDGQAFAETAIDTEDRMAFHKDFFLLLNLAVGGTWAGRPDASTDFPQDMYVDWVRIYQKVNP